jgi:hypothetical protein
MVMQPWSRPARRDRPRLGTAGPMGVFRPVVLAKALLMASAEPEMAARSPVGPKPVGEEHGRRIALLPEELAHQPQGYGRVPLGLTSRSRISPSLSTRAPQIHAPAADRDDHLIQVPGVGRPGPQPAQVAGESRPELEHPSSVRLVGDVEPALGEEFLDVAVAQREPEIEPDGVPDHLGREAVAVVGDGPHSRS